MAILFLLAGCGAADDASGGLTPDQNAVLDKSAQNLDDQRATLPKRGEQPDADEKPKN